MRLSLLALVLSLTGCGGGPAGNPEVLERIGGLSDCAVLQDEFDTAEAVHGQSTAGSERAVMATAHMQAAVDRMESLGC